MEARLHEEGGDAPLIVCVHLTLKLAFPLSFSSTSAPANDSARDAISAGLLGGYSSSSSGSMDSIFIPAMHGMHASHVSNSASGSGSGSANESVAVGAPWGAVRPLAAVRTASMPHHSVPQHAADTHSLANDPCGGVVPVPPCTLLAIMRARRASSSAVYSTYNMSPEAGASLVSVLSHWDHSLHCAWDSWISKGTFGTTRGDCDRTPHQHRRVIPHKKNHTSTRRMILFVSSACSWSGVLSMPLIQALAASAGTFRTLSPSTHSRCPLINLLRALRHSIRSSSKHASRLTSCTSAGCPGDWPSPSDAIPQYFC